MNKKNFHHLFIGLLLLAALTTRGHAGTGAGTTVGLTLLKPTGARAAALGEAFTAMTNDIDAFAYNPASLHSLKTGQASFLYEKGLADDTFGNLMVGLPSTWGHFGLSVGYHNAGNMTLVDENLNAHSVNSETDINVAAGYANSLAGLRWGVAGKYVSSKLVDQYSAQAFAMDIGVQMPILSRIEVGGAVQNIGTQMTYIDKSYGLPRIYRAGLSYLMFPGKTPTTMLFDFPYYAVEQELRPAVGVEVKTGPMAFRAGYRKTNGLDKEFTLGTGFMLGSGSLDYSFGLVNQLSSEHRISISMRFGENMGRPSAVVLPQFTSPLSQKQFSDPKMKTEEKKKEEKKSEITIIQRPTLSTLGKEKKFFPLGRQIYQVKEGDTLKTIARRYYGDESFWDEIYSLNRHIVAEDKTLEPGQRIVLP